MMEVDPDPRSVFEIAGVSALAGRAFVCAVTSRLANTEESQANVAHGDGRGGALGGQ